MNEKRPEVGTPVVTSDGHIVGTVAQLAGDCFKVDRPAAPGEWFGLDSISGIDRDVRLSLSQDALEARPEGFEHTGYHVHHEN